MKFTTERPFADPDKAACRLMEHAHAFETMQNGRICIEKINGPFLLGDKGTPAEYAAGLDRAIERGWLTMHESGTFVRFTQTGADLFASKPIAEKNQNRLTALERIGTARMIGHDSCPMHGHRERYCLLLRDQSPLRVRPPAARRLSAPY